MHASALSRFPWIAIACCAAACQVPDDARFSQLRAGMSQDEVTRLLGEPSSRHAATHTSSGAPSVQAYWQYGDNLSTLMTGAAFKDQPASDRVWAVYFDADGKVTRWQRPSWDE